EIGRHRRRLRGDRSHLDAVREVSRGERPLGGLGLQAHAIGRLPAQAQRAARILVGAAGDQQPQQKSLHHMPRLYGLGGLNLPVSASRTSRSNLIFPVAISRSAVTVVLFLVTSTIGRAPAISCRARLPASTTSAKRLSTN